MLALVLLALAAESDWSDVGKELKTGQTVDVIQTNGQAARGSQFRDVTGEAITVTLPDGSTRAIAKNDVVRVTRIGTRHRVRNAILLGAAGGVAGAAIKLFGVACAESNTGCRDTAILAFGGAGAGATLGALLPADTRTIYRRP